MILTGMLALEAWAKRVTSGYAGVNIVDLTESWRSGLAFCAIIARFRPDLIDFDKLEERDIFRNCSVAFSLADRYLGIPSLLDAEDMVEREQLDKFSITAYVAQYYHQFGNQTPLPAARGSLGKANGGERLEIMGKDSGLDDSSSSSSRESSPVMSSSTVNVSPVYSNIPMKAQHNLRRYWISSEMSSPAAPIPSVASMEKFPRNRMTMVHCRSVESLLDNKLKLFKPSEVSSDLETEKMKSSSFFSVLIKFNSQSTSNIAKTKDIKGPKHKPIPTQSSGTQTKEHLPVLFSHGTQTEDSPSSCTTCHARYSVEVLPHKYSTDYYSTEQYHIDSIRYTNPQYQVSYTPNYKRAVGYTRQAEHDLAYSTLV